MVPFKLSLIITIENIAKKSVRSKTKLNRQGGAQLSCNFQRSANKAVQGRSA